MGFERVVIRAASLVYIDSHRPQDPSFIDIYASFKLSIIINLMVSTDTWIYPFIYYVFDKLPCNQVV